MRRFGLIWISLLLILSAAVSAFAEPVKLEYKFKKGDIDKYRISFGMDMQMPGMPSGMNMEMTATEIMKTLDVLPDGSAKIKCTAKDFKMNAPFMNQKGAKASDKINDMTYTLILGKDGRIVKMEGLTGMPGAKGMIPGMDPTQMMNQLGSYVAFPADSVDVGQSWTQDVPMPTLGMQFKINSTVEALGEQMWAQSTARIKQDFSGHADLKEMMKSVASSVKGGANQKEMADALSSMSGGIDFSGNGSVVFATSIGKILKSGGDYKAIMNMKMPPQAVQQGAPAEINMTMNMKFSMTRFK